MNNTARAVQAVAFALLTLSFGVAQAAAAVHVSGDADHVVLQADKAGLDEVVGALRQSLRVDLQLKGATARKFTGTYSGSLQQVLSRLIGGDGHDFFLATNGQTLQLTLLDRKSGRAVVAAASLSGEFADANDPNRAVLAAAAAQGGGSRDSRMREQRLKMHPAAGVDPY
jgi:hypothetical protein